VRRVSTRHGSGDPLGSTPRRNPGELPVGVDGQDTLVVAPRQRSALSKALAIALTVLFFVLFVALGTWQVQRRAWKLDLIARVEQRVHAPATPAPGPSEWPKVTAATDEYRHVTATGTFLDASQTLVQAVTDLGAGYWVLTPLQAVDGTIELVNRGFVPGDDRNRVQPGGSPALMSTVTGLLRITEPGGGFLRRNNAAANQWYSRDVQAIAAANSLSHVAPYFIDAQATGHDSPSARVAGSTAPVASRADRPRAPPTSDAPSPAASADAPSPAGSPFSAGAIVAPTPGLTVIHFHNSHLVYAITWYTLALMTAIAIPLGMRKQ
jgi:surfeit locus 1 family protein